MAGVSIGRIRPKSIRKNWLKWLAVFGVGALAWEVRGLIFAAPAFYALWVAGGPVMKLWLTFCAVAGLALSVVVPRWFLRQLIRPR